MRRATQIVILSALALSACGGSDSGGSGGSSGTGGSSESSSGPGSGDAAAGLYYGTLTTGSGKSAKSITLVGLIDANGNGQFVEKGGTKALPTFEVLSPGPFSTSRTTYSFSVPYVLYGSSPTKGTLDASVNPGNNISGSLTEGGSTTPTATFLLGYQGASWEIPSSLTTIAGTYSGTFVYDRTTYSPTLSIDGAGAISGHDPNGCKYSGTVSVPDSTRNGYELSLTSSCHSSLPLTGVGAYFAKKGTTPAYFRAALDNPGKVGIYLKLKQTSSATGGSSSSSSSSGG
ncbi:MAG: hypothetical protein P4L83_22435 [Nevskia sp.]|nr:hypothetical protein [Nevskia sp.]